MKKQIILDKLVVIVVFYNPSLDQICRINNLASNLHIVTVDNSNNSLEGKFNFIYLPQNENTGIAKAQNIGIKYAQQQHYEYVLFLDQDSIIEKVYAINILNAYKRIKKKDFSVVMVGSILFDRRTGENYKSYVDKDATDSKVSSLISSGSIAEVSSFSTIGYFDEDLFIDYVDFEWCWRAIFRGFSLYITREVKLSHSIGSSYRNCHGFVVNISSPVRYYYQYRNTILLLKRNYVPIGWKVKSVLRKLLDLIILPFFAQCGTFNNIIKGIKDGVTAWKI